MKKYFLEWQRIIWNEIALFGMKLKYFELKLIKRNVPGVSLWGMPLSIEKNLIDRSIDPSIHPSIYLSYLLLSYLSIYVFESFFES